MKLLFRYIYRQIFEKKGRTLLLILSIAISGSLIYASLGVKDCLTDIFYEKLTAAVGEADIIISNDEEKNHDIVVDNDNGIGNYYHLIDGFGIINTDTSKEFAIVQGIDYDDMNSLYNIEFENANTKKDLFDGDVVIISSNTAQKYGYNIDDIIKLQIYNEEYEFKIVGIAKNYGPFMDELTGIKVFLPLDTLSEKMMLFGGYNRVYIDLNDADEIDSCISRLQSKYDEYVVEEAVDKTRVNDDIAIIQVSMLASTVLAVILCIVIIYLSFNLIVSEQLPQIGTFRSLGASKRKTDFIMLMEAFFLGMIGAIVGIIMGVGVTYLITLLSLPEKLKDIADVKIEFNILYMFISGICAILISLVGVIVPILRIRKISIKNIVLNTISIKEMKNSKKRVVFLFLLIIAAIVPNVVSNFILPSSIGALIITFVSTILLIPLLLKICSKIFYLIMQPLMRNIEKIICQNVVSYNKIKNCSSLIMNCVGIILILSVLMTSLNVIVVDEARRIEVYDLSINLNNAKEDDIKKLDNIDGVKEYYEFNSFSSVKIDGTDRKITVVDSIKDSDFMKYRALGIKDEKIFNELNEGNNIVLSKTLGERLDLGVGDEISIEINDEIKKYKVIALFETYIFTGSYALIPFDSIMNDDEETYNSVFINIDSDANLEVVTQLVKNEIGDKCISITSRSAFIQNLVDTMEQMTNIIKWFMYLAILVGVIGIVNNIYLNFVERKRLIAMMRSIGMSARQVRVMLNGEAVIMGAAGAIMGVVLAYVLLRIVPMIMNIANVDMPIHLGIKECLIYGIGAIIVTVISSNFVSIGIKKLDLVSLIKVE